MMDYNFARYVGRSAATPGQKRKTLELPHLVCDVWTEDKLLTAQRLFIWDDKKTHCGVVLFPPGSVSHFSRVKKVMEKLVVDADLRQQHRRVLRFPLERYYSEYGAFPEESSN